MNRRRSKRGLLAHCEATGNWDLILTERLVGRVRFWLQVEPNNKTAKRLMAELSEFQRALDSGIASDFSPK
jgi:hypothetical protein